MIPKNQSKDMLDRAIGLVRNDSLDAGRMEAAASRVRSSLGSGESAPVPEGPARLRSCEDVQALFPAYRAGSLRPAREALVQDHLNECVDCRRKFHGEKRPLAIDWKNTVAATGGFSRRRYAWAAALLAGVLLGGYAMRDYFLPAPAGMRARIESADGPLYVLSPQGVRTVSSGAEISDREWLRVPGGGHATVSLRDGSRIELRERSELSVSMNRTDTTVHLERGSVIVQAAKRRMGHLFVSAPDCNVAVKGTVFSVNSGIRGSRVAVIEGEVHVAQRRGQMVLHAGDQTATDQSVQPVRVQDEIAWSRNLDQHLSLLKEFAALDKKLQAVHQPGLRYDSTLLGAVPADTVLYAAIPNYGEALAEAHQMFEQQIRESSVLREWWSQTAGSRGGQDLSTLITKIRALSDYLGSEIVLASNGKQGPVLLAEVKRSGLAEFLRAELPDLGIRVLTASNLAAANPSGPNLFLSDRFAILGNLDQVRAIAPLLNSDTGFRRTPYGQRISQVYQSGAGMVFTANLSQIVATVGKNPQVLQKSGIDDVQYLVVEQKKVGDHTESGASISFAGERHGLASILAAPAPQGSLAFISGNASAVLAAVVKTPSQIIDDLFGAGESLNQSFRGEVNEVQQRLGVDLRQDLAASLGTDFALALDGPAMPDPSWKLIVEVNDPARLQQAISKLAEAFNQDARKHGRKGLEITRGEQNGRVLYEWKLLDAGLSATYLFTDGYLVAGPNRTVVSNAVRTRESGWGLARNPGFRDLLPHDGRTNFSAMVYHNLGPLALMLSQVANSAAALSDEQKRRIAAMANDSRPQLIYAYGERDRIQVASTGGFFGLGLDSVLGGAGLASLAPKMIARSPVASLGETAGNSGQPAPQPRTVERKLKQFRTFPPAPAYNR